jgi:hypothetical protein
MERNAPKGPGSRAKNYTTYKNMACRENPHALVLFFAFPVFAIFPLPEQNTNGCFIQSGLGTDLID